jgi:hypothetical protein
MAQQREGVRGRREGVGERDAARLGEGGDQHAVALGHKVGAGGEAAGVELCEAVERGGVGRDGAAQDDGGVGGGHAVMVGLRVHKFQ